MINVARWKCLGGDEISDADNESSLPELIPRVSGLYLWRRRIICEGSTVSTSSVFSRWLERLADDPSGVLNERRLSHGVRLTGIRVGGGGLTADKRESLSIASENRRMRERVGGVMASLTQYMPPIYIGEANNLCSRISQHLRGETHLKDYIFESLGLHWGDVEVHYHELSSTINSSDRAKSLQELLELIAQRALAPFGTDRPG